MTPHNDHSDVPVTKNSETEGPIPSAWRPVLEDIVDAFVSQDYRLADGGLGVAPVSEETATQIREYIEDYGAKLVGLPQEAWDTSVYLDARSLGRTYRSVDGRSRQ